MHKRIHAISILNEFSGSTITSTKGSFIAKTLHASEYDKFIISEDRASYLYKSYC